MAFATQLVERISAARQILGVDAPPPPKRPKAMPKAPETAAAEGGAAESGAQGGAPPPLVRQPTQSELHGLAVWKHSLQSGAWRARGVAEAAAAVARRAAGATNDDDGYCHPALLMSALSSKLRQVRSPTDLPGPRMISR